jgi:hypothetical protein
LQLQLLAAAVQQQLTQLLLLLPVGLQAFGVAVITVVCQEGYRQLLALSSQCIRAATVAAAAALHQETLLPLQQRQQTRPAEQRQQQQQ